MTEETKELFDLPWFIGDDSDDYSKFSYIVHSSSTAYHPIASCINSREMANRFMCLPELYEALIDAAYKTCHDCIYVTLKQDNVPLPNELIKNGCPMKFECSIKKAWKLLNLVKEGKLE